MEQTSARICRATMTTILSSKFSMLELPLNTQSSWPMLSSKFKWSIIVPLPKVFHPPQIHYIISHCPMQINSNIFSGLLFVFVVLFGGRMPISPWSVFLKAGGKQVTVLITREKEGNNANRTVTKWILCLAIHSLRWIARLANFNVWPLGYALRFWNWILKFCVVADDLQVMRFASETWDSLKNPGRF